MDFSNDGIKVGGEQPVSCLLIPINERHVGISIVYEQNSRDVKIGCYAITRITGGSISNFIKLSTK